VSARDEILRVAGEHGWSIKSSPSTEELRRDAVTVHVEFSIRDAVTYTSRNFRRHSGPGKLLVVLGWLREGRET
jgi:hypothetical protein